MKDYFLNVSMYQLIVKKVIAIDDKMSLMVIPLLSHDSLPKNICSDINETI